MMKPRRSYQAALLSLSILGLFAGAAACCQLRGAEPPQPTPPAVLASSAEPSAAAAPDAGAAGAHGLPDANMERAAIPERYKWQLAPLFSSDEAFEKALAEVAAEREKLATYAGKLARPAELRAFLDQYFKTRLLTNKLTLYANLRFDSQQKSSALQSMNDRSLAALNALTGAASFMRREVMAIDDRAMARAYRSDPALAAYRPYLDELRRRRARVLGAEAERILALAGDNLWAEIDLNEIPSDVEKIARAARAELSLPEIEDEQGKAVQLTLANYGKYRASDQRTVRRDTVEGFFAALKARENTFAAALSGQLRLDVLYARARGYDTALQAYLDKDDIDPEVYRTLIRAVNANFAPLHRYVRLRKKLAAVDELHVYDLYAPMVQGSRMKVPYEEALAILPKALAPLGEEYVTALAQGLDAKNGWIDVYPHKDKDSGAFSVFVYGVHPFIKMNYQDEVDDLSTLAHELGHGMHSHLSMTHQPYVTANYPAFVAEVASTLNEKLLSDHLLARAQTDAERLYILNRLVESIRTTIYRQALFAEFELEAHTEAEKGTALTAELFNATYAGLVHKYYGPDYTVGVNDGVEWAYIPHFFFKYYLFAYATGLSAGIALADRIARGGAEARRDYLGMLESGSSRPPLELLRRAGVDLTQPHAVEAAAKLFDETLGRIEAILAKPH